MTEHKQTFATTTKQIIEKCERTGKFNFNSRRFASVGEFDLAFHGIYRFVEGNPEFKSELGEDYIWLKTALLKNGRLTTEESLAKLKIYKW